MSRGGAFVVGGTGGLGAAACHALARDWSGVAVGYRSSRAKAEDVAAVLPGGCEGLAVPCDLADAGSITAAVSTTRERFGGVGTVVFASGVAIEQPYVHAIGEAAWREVIETELIGLTRVVAATLPVFREQGHGNFVIVVSVANYAYPPGDALSSVPKAGMEALGRAIAKEEGRFGIRANMVAPGIIEAGLGSHFLETLYTPAVWESQKRKIALRRFGGGAEIGEAIAFLASDRAAYITGQTLIVDGGFSL